MGGVRDFLFVPSQSFELKYFESGHLEPRAWFQAQGNARSQKARLEIQDLVTLVSFKDSSKGTAIGFQESFSLKKKSKQNIIQTT